MSDDKLFDEIDFLQSFHIDPVLTSKAFEECESYLPGFSDDFTNILSPTVSQRPGVMFTPAMFKMPALLKPHSCTNQKLTNLSFSQPTTPKTPAFACHLGTPLVSTLEVAVLTTPMLIKTLDDIQQEARIKDRLAPCPDILQLIDDDSRCTSVRLDRHLKQCSESNVTDDNLVDYLLNLSQEAKHHASTDNRTQLEKKPSTNQVYKSSPRVFHRARRRTKLMTEEERISIQRHQSEKRKQKRKNRFTNVPRTGTRKSQRTRTQAVRYS